MNQPEKPKWLGMPVKSCEGDKLVVKIPVLQLYGVDWSGQGDADRKAYQGALSHVINLFQIPELAFPIPQVQIGFEKSELAGRMACYLEFRLTEGSVPLAASRASREVLETGVCSLLRASGLMVVKSFTQNNCKSLLLPDLLGGFEYPESTFQNCYVQPDGKLLFTGIYPLLEINGGLWRTLFGATSRTHYNQTLISAASNYGLEAMQEAIKIAECIAGLK